MKKMKKKPGKTIQSSRYLTFSQSKNDIMWYIYNNNNNNLKIPNAFSW